MQAGRNGVPAPEAILDNSDIKIDPAIRLGRLNNGLLYAIIANATPPGTGEIRLRIDAGSLDEEEHERGFAHFVEHMAFNGSTSVPEGEMIRLLQREGLAFGADTNASTGFEATTYRLRLPSNRPELLDTALMLFREIGSELTFDAQAVERERGVLLSELRDRHDYRLKETIGRYRFETPGSRHWQRLPIGGRDSLENADGAALLAFWKRHYRPERAAIIIAGDFDVDAVAQAIEHAFSDWTNDAPAAPAREYGGIAMRDRGRMAVYIDPALSERLTASAAAPALPAADSADERQRNVLRRIGYGIVNRRLARRSRDKNAPFASAGFGTGTLFRMGQVTRLVVDTEENGWPEGIAASVAIYRDALQNGFSSAEVDEQWANILAAVENGATGAQTRSHAALADGLVALLDTGTIPATPASALARLEAMRALVTPANVLSALKEDALPLTDPDLRFRGRTAPAGGGEAMRAAWHKAMQASSMLDAHDEAGHFAYDDFGPSGTVATDKLEPVYQIRTIRFANNVRLNLKRTSLAQDRISISLTIDGGDLLTTAEEPLGVQLVPLLAAGGLGKHDADSLQTLLAGRSVGLGLTSAGDAFVASRTTTSRDLELQLKLLAALVADPGFREEPVARYRRTLPDTFARLNATPFAALRAAEGGILSQTDPRFTLQSQAAYEALSFASLRETIGPSLAHGAVEIGIVGDFNEDAAIAAVARSFGALGQRDAAFAPRTTARRRSFTTERAEHVVHHAGARDQALIRAIWPTTDDSDPELAARLELLEKVAGIALTEELRERLGQAYSPSADSSMSNVYAEYGTFSLTAAVALDHLAPSQAALMAVVAELRDHPVSADLLNRARQPLLDTIDNALKTNAGWLGLVGRAQGRAERLARFEGFRQRIEAITPDHLQQAAQRWLNTGDAVIILVVPDKADQT
ncbi:insulinase family protein [Croceicoccus sp. F390]|uniref:Insulinase family protein n=1 Tax=Croceicoccus esteveae TaxID=3075597 RepID=A0ABU2ZI44_9SPHN|nr:insulinase family protein [Croceicoccus sp. F390]MDT0575072.1 insulinase family protein [Croceicoccus sp. F390]